MADYQDLETDGAELRKLVIPNQRGNMHVSSTEVQNRSSLCDDRMDSGYGLSFEEPEHSGFSLEFVQKYIQSEEGQSLRNKISKELSPVTNITSALQNQFSSLTLSSSEKCKDTGSRCDSGVVCSVEDGLTCESAFPECSNFSIFNQNDFSVQELEELFSQDEDGDTHLHMSIIHLLTDVSLRIVNLAPSYDCINISNSLHQTPLHLAVATQQHLVTRRLMAAGAALESPDHNGNTALHVACRDGMKEIVQVLLQPVLYQETLENSYEIPYQRIPQDLHLRNYDGLTCAHLALLSGHLDILQLLLHKGADVNEQDGKSGRTLLHMAADLGYGEALDLLLRQGSLNLNARTYGGLTAAALAHGRHLTDVVNRLAIAGADCTELSDDPESTDEEMSESVYDDICIGGQPVDIY